MPELPKTRDASQQNSAEEENDIDGLREEVDRLREENRRKDEVIAALQAQLAGSQQVGDFLASGTNLRKESLSGDGTEEREPKLSPHDITSNGSQNEVVEFDIEKSIQDVQKWLFLETENIRDMISQYCQYVRESIGIQLDRLFLGRMSAPGDLARPCIWKWEVGTELDEHEIPPNIFDDPDFADEAFTRLFHGQVTSVRMRQADSFIPKHSGWFRKKNYTDFLALPMQHRGQFIGAVSWATKNPDGFSDDHIAFFQKSFAAFATVVRVHVNDHVYTKFTDRLAVEVAERTRDLAEANKRIVQQSTAQLHHFANMSHEIRTPLNCIIGLSSLLVDSELDESQQESLSMIIRSGDVLVNVVNDVLDYSRLESGNIELILEPTNLLGAVEIVIQSVMSRANKRQVNIEKNVDPAIPGLVNTDGNRLQQILYNLLCNAVKFSPENQSVEISALLVTEEAKSTNSNVDNKSPPPSATRKIRFSIKDYGPGIEESELESIFQPFKQGGDGSARFREGSSLGLGLAITSNLVKSLDGTISATSEVGQWAEFVVILPCNPVPIKSLLNPQGPVDTTPLVKNSTYRTVRDSSPSSVGSGPTMQEEQEQKRKDRLLRMKSQPSNVIREGTRILVTDDIQVNRKVLVRMLTRIGAKNVDMAENGLEACEMEAKSGYDLIFMDIEMPVMDGLEATRRILKRERTGNEVRPKVVFVTAHALATFHAKAVEAGGCGFLTKPINLNKLISAFSSIDMHNGCRQLPIS